MDHPPGSDTTANGLRALPADDASSAFAPSHGIQSGMKRGTACSAASRFAAMNAAPGLNQRRIALHTYIG